MILCQVTTVYDVKLQALVAMDIGCEVFGGKPMAARYSCREDRPDCWAAHQAEHDAINVRKMQEILQAKARAEAAKEAAKVAV